MLAATGRKLLVQVEEAQARFDRWPVREGAAIVRGVVGELTGLFALPPRWAPGDLAASVQALGALIDQLAQALVARVGGQLADALQGAGRDLTTLAGQLRAAPFTEPAALSRVLGAVQILLRLFPIVSGL